MYDKKPIWIYRTLGTLPLGLFSGGILYQKMSLSLDFTDI
jgi:hypothetical protein